MPTILVVEDNEPSRDALARRLARRGFVVVTATDGRQGVTLARSLRPDLILMDLGLPEMDGWEATRLLKEEPATSRIPIVVLSAHAMTNDREMALEAGSDDFDTKPVRFPALLAKIDRLLKTGAVR